MADGVRRETHPLSLRVMRLCRPRVLGTPPKAPKAALWHSAADGALGSVALPETADAVTTDLASDIMLPEGFGSIFVGQVFGSYISVENHSAYTLSTVALTAELQTEGARRITLIDKRVLEAGGTESVISRKDFAPGASVDMVVEQGRLAKGEHILRVCVTYSDPAMPGTTKSFRKFYRFAVTDPFRFHHRHVDLKGEHLVELQIQNATSAAVSLHRVQFVPNEVFEAQGVVVPHDDGDDDAGAAGAGGASTGGDVAGATLSGSAGSLGVAGEFTAVPVLRPNEIRQLVYRLAAAPGRAIHSQSMADLGFMQIEWRTAMGEYGAWQSAQVVRKIPARPPVEIELEDVPATVALGSRFPVRVVVRNRTSTPQKMRLVVTEVAFTGLLEVDGLASQNLGIVAPRAVAECRLHFVACSAGLQPVRGLVVIDADTGAVFSSVPGRTARTGTAGAASGAAAAAPAGSAGVAMEWVDDAVVEESRRTLGHVFVDEGGSTVVDAR